MTGTLNWLLELCGFPFLESWKVPAKEEN
jgi:hypothetical protein